MKSQKGFALLEGLLILIIIALVAGTGYYAWHSKQQTYKTLDTTANQSLAAQSQKKTSSTSTTTTPDQKYLTVKEWGVRIKLSTPISDAYYESTNTDTPVFSQIGLSLQSLKDTQCRATAWPPSIYFRYTDNDTDPVSGQHYTKTDGTKHKIGDYYYAYGSGLGSSKERGGCQSTDDAQARATEADRAFGSALDTIESTQE